MQSAPGILALPMTAAYFRLITRRYGDLGEPLPPERADGDGQADPGLDADCEIHVGSQLGQLQRLQAIAPPDWGLDLGAVLDVATHGPAGLIAVSAPTLGAALDVVGRYMTVRTPFVDLRVTDEAERIGLRVVEPCSAGAARMPLLELVLLSLQATIESALGRRIPEAAFTMPAPRPAYWRRYDEVFHAPVTFAGSAAAVTLPRQWLSLPCPLADPLMHRSTRTRLEALRQRLAGDFIDARIERILAAGDDAGPSLGELAARLRVSTRTLVRRLEQRRTSYRALLDRHRCTRSRELLAQPGLSVAEIAERLGYQEPTNFARACRRWFGMSPRTYRARLGIVAPGPDADDAG